MRTCTSGNGTPIDPGRRSVVIGLPTTTGEVSVRPYPSTSSPPVAASQRCTSGAGSGIAPDRPYRMPWMLTPRRSASSTIRSYSGGTAGTKVGTARSMASMSRATSGLGRSTSVAARSMPSSIPTVTP